MKAVRILALPIVALRFKIGAAGTIIGSCSLVCFCGKEAEA